MRLRELIGSGEAGLVLRIRMSWPPPAVTAMDLPPSECRTSGFASRETVDKLFIIRSKVKIKGV
jgi:hypothetical protein